MERNADGRRGLPGRLGVRGGEETSRVAHRSGWGLSGGRPAVAQRPAPRWQAGAISLLSRPCSDWLVGHRLGSITSHGSPGQCGLPALQRRANLLLPLRASPPTPSLPSLRRRWPPARRPGSNSQMRSIYRGPLTAWQRNVNLLPIRASPPTPSLSCPCRKRLAARRTGFILRRRLYQCGYPAWLRSASRCPRIPPPIASQFRPRCQ